MINNLDQQQLDVAGNFNGWVTYEDSLCRFACKSKDAKRLHPISDEVSGTAYRSPYGRDRHRIVSSKAFRRLAHKTQVYLSIRGNEHLRTRLTHTVEVAQIAKDIARHLRVNEDLVEAIAVGHDLGHAPFGHSGEKQLNEFLLKSYPLPSVLTDMMKNYNHVMSPMSSDSRYGIFRHNYQSVRLLTWLNEYIPQQYGLNISFQVLEGILKHTKIQPAQNAYNYQYPSSFLQWLSSGDTPWPQTIEGQIVAVADEIAQVAHDLSDAVTLRVLGFDDLMKLPALTNAFTKAREIHTRGESNNINRFKRWGRSANDHVAPIIVNYFARQTALEMANSIAAAEKTNASNPAINGWLLRSESDGQSEEPSLGPDFKELKQFKDDFVINNFMVNRMDKKGEHLIRQLFDVYISDPRQLSDAVLSRYFEMKKSDARKMANTNKYPKDWLCDTEETYHIENKLTIQEKLLITRMLLDKRSDGTAMRRMPRTVLEKLKPYMVWDGDYRRAIIDHIANMSDSFAENEVRNLYR